MAHILGRITFGDNRKTTRQEFDSWAVARQLAMPLIGDSVEWYIEPQDCPFVGQVVVYDPPYQPRAWVQLTAVQRLSPDHNYTVNGRVLNWIDPQPPTLYPLPYDEVDHG